MSICNRPAPAPVPNGAPCAASRDTLKHGWRPAPLWVKAERSTAGPLLRAPWMNRRLSVCASSGRGLTSALMASCAAPPLCHSPLSGPCFRLGHQQRPQEEDSGSPTWAAQSSPRVGDSGSPTWAAQSRRHRRPEEPPQPALPWHGRRRAGKARGCAPRAETRREGRASGSMGRRQEAQPQTATADLQPSEAQCCPPTPPPAHVRLQRDGQCHGCRPPLSVREAVVTAEASPDGRRCGGGCECPLRGPRRPLRFLALPAMVRWPVLGPAPRHRRRNQTHPRGRWFLPVPCAWQAAARRPSRRPNWHQGGRQGYRAANKERRWRARL